MWIEGSGLGEEAVGAESAIDLIGGDLVEADERLVPRSGEGSMQESLRTEDIGSKEDLRVIDGAVDVGLGGEIDDVVDVETLEKAMDKGGISDVAMDEDAAPVVNEVLNGSEVPGVSEGIEGDETVMGVCGEHVVKEIGADEAGGTGDEVSVHSIRDLGARSEKRPVSVLAGEKRGMLVKQPVDIEGGVVVTDAVLVIRHIGIVDLVLEDGGR